MFFDLPEDSIVYGDSAYTGTTMKKFAESQLEYPWGLPEKQLQNALYSFLL